jgi:alkanesulfonate monooxygenase SsuD/methylene tetrahydromethanopterin reductase-like flavin-dependent oxidoreductase (luciferase family)
VAKDLMRPTIVRSLVAQQPHFRTFATAGLELPIALREQIAALGYTHDPTRLAPAAALVPDAFVDAVTLAGTVEEVAGRVLQLQQLGITHVLINPLAPDDNIEQVIHTFAHEVMPRINDQLSA